MRYLKQEAPNRSGAQREGAFVVLALGYGQWWAQHRITGSLVQRRSLDVGRGLSLDTSLGYGAGKGFVFGIELWHVTAQVRWKDEWSSHDGSYSTIESGKKQATFSGIGAFGQKYFGDFYIRLLLGLGGVTAEDTTDYNPTFDGLIVGASAGYHLGHFGNWAHGFSFGWVHLGREYEGRLDDGSVYDGGVVCNYLSTQYAMTYF